MDRTAVASVIVGLGVAIAAMVFPTKYPQTPKPIINGIWWFGIALIILGACYLVTEHPLADLAGVAANAGLWFIDAAKTIQRLPGFWLAVAFAVGMAANQWMLPYIRNLRPNRINDLSIGEWYSPQEAVRRFANPSLLERHTQALSLLAELSGDSTKRALAEYLVSCTDSDVKDDLRKQLGDGSLIAKGFPVKNGKTLPSEKQIDFHFWKIVVIGMPLSINFNTGEGYNILGHYRNITIAEPSERHAA